MASISLPRVLTQRRGGPVEVERENFWKSQMTSISKAINNQETPVKEKHVRSTIIGSYHERGVTTFWAVVGALPIQGNPIVCWKFCHTLHKLLREGHPNVIPESKDYRGRLLELGKYWGHLKDTYGKLISNYCRLLATKLEFHYKNPKFPGNLQLTDEQLESIGEMDINNFFQITVEMFDYMDEILNLQESVFNSQRPGNANSMTSSGQCRLAPLIPCIQDSSHLYDYIVKLLFKLHSSLPPDILVGHRDRFYKEFKVLREFYVHSSHLQYFKHLIQIPLLPEEPPNFLIKSGIASHISPVVILPPQDDIPDNDSVVDMTLVDTSSPTPFDVGPTNGTASPELLYEKDQIIETLRREIEELRREIQLTREEDQNTIGEFQRQSASLEAYIQDLQQQVSQKQKEIESFKIASTEITEVKEKLDETEKKYKATDGKLNKMKDMYSKIRVEHIALIRSKAEVEKQLGSIKQASNDTARTKSDLEEQINEMRNDRVSLQQQVADLQEQMAALETEVQDAKQESEELQRQKTQEFIDRQFTLLIGCLAEAEIIVKNTLDEIEDPIVIPLHSSPEFLLRTVEPVSQLLDRLEQQNDSYRRNSKDVEHLLRAVTRLSHHLAKMTLAGKATANVLQDIEQGDKLTVVCQTCGKDALQLFSSMKAKDSELLVAPNIKKLRTDVDDLRKFAESLVSSSAANVQDKIGDLVEQELTDMEIAIEEAASRIADILNKSRKADTGIKLEVSEKILDACTALMESIKVLVKRSKDMQQEIVNQGKGSASVKEFYKRNHQWTEGLLSAAKAVGIGAKFLVDAADKVVSGKAKFETLMAASQGIAASVAQLVVSSKVKASPASVNLSQLSKASVEVRGCTGTVVATVKDCAQMMEDSEVMNFENLTLHQAKRLEMESQVKVLELENNLDKERVKLAALRKKHYTMADPTEGWEQE